MEGCYLQYHKKINDRFLLSVFIFVVFLPKSLRWVLAVQLNICAKINHYAYPNSMVIGGDLYEIVKTFKEFKFKFVRDFSNGFRFKCPVYSVIAER